MFFFLAQTLGFLFLPVHLLLELILISVILLWTRWRRAGRALVTISAIILISLWFLPISALLVRPLEDRFPQPQLAEAPTGIIVLGGAVDERLTVGRRQPSLNEAAERMTESVALALRYPKARLVYSGGIGRLRPVPITEADVAAMVWTSLGVAPERMEFENRSRNTWENALFTKELVKPKPGETWLLVTSATHMPRSIGIFRKIGFPVVAYPVDYRTAGNSSDFTGLRNVPRSLIDLDVASHEWIGLLAYYLTGKTSEILPAP